MRGPSSIRNSRLPSAPVMGDGSRPSAPILPERAAAVTSSTTRACTAGSRTMPPAPDLGAAGLELRLDERDDAAARREERRDDGQDVPQRDERHVNRDEVERAGDPAAARPAVR